jgi:hypothetical protein
MILESKTLYFQLLCKNHVIAISFVISIVLFIFAEQALFLRNMLHYNEAKYLYIHPHYGCKIKISPILILFHPYGFFIQKNS